jgi:hypothetical protein
MIEFLFAGWSMATRKPLGEKPMDEWKAVALLAGADWFPPNQAPRQQTSPTQRRFRSHVNLRASTAMKPQRTPATAQQQIADKPGRSPRCRSLFARSAGVHVDFHADRHFDDLWSFPAH